MVQSTNGMVSNASKWIKNKVNFASMLQAKIKS